MTDTSIQAAIEAEYETELSRLGSSKALYALTGGELETEAVLEALADRAATTAATFESWTDGDEAVDVFEAAAETARSHAERIEGVAEAVEPTDSPTSMDDVLRGLEDAGARVGGLLAWTLVTDRTLSQAVGFFVGNADPKAADRFRDMRSDVDARREGVLDVAERLDGADRDHAREAANRTVEAAYEDYVEALEGMGVKVKPVC